MLSITTTLENVNPNNDLRGDVAVPMLARRRVEVSLHYNAYSVDNSKLLPIIEQSQVPTQT
jgi:hypothetical protein